MTRVVVYPRVSTANQKGGLSLGQQEKECLAHCEKHGYEVAAVIPETYTAHDSLDARPELKRARDMIQSGQADGLLVWKIDRASRDMVDGLILLREIGRAGGFLESVLRGRVKTDANGKMQFALELGQAEGEWDDIALRTQPLIRRRAEMGKPLVGGCPPYGYRFEGKHHDALVIDPDTAPTVARVFDLINRGVSTKQIALTLQAGEIPTATQVLADRGELDGRSSADRWRAQRIIDMVRNSTYCGKRIAYGRKRVMKVSKKTGKDYPTSVRRDPTDPKCIVQECPAIVSEAVWLQAQAQLQRNKEGSVRNALHPELALLRGGIAKCGHCGANMVVGYQNRRKGPAAIAYICPRRPGNWDGDPAKVCPGGSFIVTAGPVDADVWAKAEAILQDTPRLRALLDQRRDENQARLLELQSRVGDTQAEIADHEDQLAWLVEQVGKERNDRMYAILSERIKAVDDALTKLRSRETKASWQASLIDQFVNNLEAALQQYVGNWDGPKTVVENADGTRSIWLKDPDIEDRAVEILLEKDQDRGPTWQDKRHWMGLLGVKVRLYATNSDYYRETGLRHEFTFADGQVENATSTRFRSSAR
jgi:DNA invertase Pin-like site-specific DNA recombinase